jgi:exosortase
MTTAPPHSDPSVFQRFVAPTALSVSLGWLWIQLINHLRIEWTVNSQYAYGWAVPFLCLFLLWRNFTHVTRHPQCAPASLDPRPGGVAARHLPSTILHLLWISSALLYLPTRLIQEANPEWRFVSWALALEVVTITLCLISAFQRFRISAFVFPVCFFLVAVPWPTLVEGPLIQALTRANAGLTIELLNTFGIPALQRGNVIEISTGLVGIDDACSGIRSFQATLMISLFLGELYRLSVLRRLALVLSGFALAFVFNVGRTLLLVTVAAKKGVPAISQWHDPAGVTILVGCFVGLWLIGIALARGPKSKVQSPESAEDMEKKSAGAYFLSSILQLPSSVRLLVGFLCVWLLLVEIGTEFWYRSHERKAVAVVDWRPALPDGAADFKPLPISENARRILRYDSGQNVAWINPDGSRWQMIFLHWNGGRVAAHLARNHTPEVCLSAAGHELKDVSDVKAVIAHGVSFPFRLYTFQNGPTPLFVFFCLLEDRDQDDVFTTAELTYDSRFAAVQAGRRNLGQRSLEIAIWGKPDAVTAEAALREQLPQLIMIR